MAYNIEAKRKSLEGRLVIGAREGYEDQKEFSAEELISFLCQVNSQLSQRNKLVLPAIITRGILIGRSDQEEYREPVFYVDFAWSPRMKPITNEAFYQTICKYGEDLGRLMKQKRIYVEFNGETTVLKEDGI